MRTEKKSLILCGKCQFFEPKSENYGECRYRAPYAVYNSQDQGVTSFWPLVSKDDACGDGQERWDARRR